MTGHGQTEHNVVLPIEGGVVVASREQEAQPAEVVLEVDLDSIKEITVVDGRALIVWEPRVARALGQQIVRAANLLDPSGSETPGEGAPVAPEDRGPEEGGGE